MGRLSLGGIIYLIIGLVVANNRGYLLGLSNISHIISALLAIILWPLIFLGIHFNISL